MSATAAMQMGDDHWNARVYAGLSVVSELTAVLSGPKPATFSPLSDWRIYSRLRTLNRDLDQVLAEYNRPVAFPPNVPCDRLRVGRDILLQLYSDCNRLLSLKDEFPLHLLTGRRLARLQTQSESILDLADWFDAMSNPNEVSSKFEVARADLASGNVLPWSSVQ